MATKPQAKKKSAPVKPEAGKPAASPRPAPQKSAVKAPAPAKKAAPAAAAKSATKPKSKTSAAPAVSSSSAGAGKTPPSRHGVEKSEEVDPLLAARPEPFKLVGGLDRDAQLPTTLVPRADLPGAVPLTVHAQAVPGAAQHGNTQPANILVLVSCGGWPVVDLNEDHFSVMEHFELPGQTAPFSNNLVSFRNAGSGAYLIQVRPISSAPWQSGHHLAQVLVSSPDERHGQTAVKLIIR